jgi:DNA-binding MarR family transcriptional regulator
VEIQCDCYCLRQATRRVTQLFDRTLAPLNLRSTQYSLLNEVARLGPIAIIPLAEALVMDRATLGHNIRPLEGRGYLRVVVGVDRRSREVSARLRAALLRVAAADFGDE